MARFRQDGLTEKERFEALLHRQPVDRVPFYMWEISFAAITVGYPKVTTFADPVKSFDAFRRTHEMFDGWHYIYYTPGAIGVREFGGEAKLPTGVARVQQRSARPGRSARFSDLHRAPIETVKWNLEHCGFSARAEVRRGDAFAMLAARPDRQFEFIYIAPPQFKEMWSAALLALDENPGWLTDTGWAMVQIAPKEYHSLELHSLEEVDQRKYGSTLLAFFELKET